MEKILSFCSISLVVTGANLFIRQKTLIILRTLFRTWFATFALYINFEHLMFTYGIQGFSLTFAAHLVFHLTRITCLTIIISKRRQIESFAIRSLDCMSKPDLSLIWKKVLIINLIMFSVKLFIFGMFGLLTNKLYYGFSALLHMILYGTVSCFSETCGFYSIMLFILSARIHATLDCIEKRFKEGEGTVSHYVSKIHADVKEFDHLFSFLPFCWFIVTVVETPRMILALKVYMCDFGRVFDAIAAIFNLTVSPLLVCVLISHVKSSINDAVDNVYHKVVTSNQTPGQKILIRYELKTLKNISFTGLEFFTIDRSFVLSIIGAVCTVYVLIATYASTV